MKFFLTFFSQPTKLDEEIRHEMFHGYLNTDREDDELHSAQNLSEFLTENDNETIKMKIILKKGRDTFTLFGVETNGHAADVTVNLQMNSWFGSLGVENYDDNLKFNLERSRRLAVVLGDHLDKCRRTWELQNMERSKVIIEEHVDKIRRLRGQVYDLTRRVDQLEGKKPKRPVATKGSHVKSAPPKSHYFEGKRKLEKINE